MTHALNAHDVTQLLMMQHTRNVAITVISLDSTAAHFVTHVIQNSIFPDVHFQSFFIILNVMMHINLSNTVSGNSNIGNSTSFHKPRKNT